MGCLPPCNAPGRCPTSLMHTDLAHSLQKKFCQDILISKEQEPSWLRSFPLKNLPANSGHFPQLLDKPGPWESSSTGFVEGNVDDTQQPPGRASCLLSFTLALMASNPQVSTETSTAPISSRMDKPRVVYSYDECYSDQNDESHLMQLHGWISPT